MPLDNPIIDSGVLDGLLSDIKGGRSVHAYLFESEQSTAACETARRFAAALLCESEGEKPCGVCTSCIQSAGGSNPDLQSLALSDLTDKKSVGADEIRSLVSDVYTKPFRAQRKVYIIEDGDALTAYAQNAMLKVLEEPPSYAVFIICTSNAELILPTVRSRSRIVRFVPKNDVQIVQYVKNVYPHMSDKAEIIAALCTGDAGRADTFCAGSEIWELREKVMDAFAALLKGTDEEAVFSFGALFDEVKKNKALDGGVSLLLDFMLSFASDLLCISSGVKQEIVNADLGARLRDAAEKASYERLICSAQHILKAKQMLLRYVNGKAALLWLAVNIFCG